MALLCVVFAFVAPRPGAAAEGASWNNVSIKLKFVDPEARTLQMQLFQEFGILAINRSDEHSPDVLRNFLLLLRNAYSRKAIRSLRDVKYIYAFYSHDAHMDIAAYHPTEMAISIGGISSYPRHGSPVDGEAQIELLAALAHELGHAFLLERISSKELALVSKTFGGWNFTHRRGPVENLFSKIFFSSHPLVRMKSSFGTHERHTKWRKLNIVSDYALTNIHEWFADAFAAFSLDRLGQQGVIGKNWQRRLLIIPKNRRDYWANYNNLSSEFFLWIQRKLEIY